jgi:hypothetical protein
MEAVLAGARSTLAFCGCNAPMKDDLYITEPNGPRFELAIERASAGFPFIFDRVAFRLDNDCVDCAVQSSWDMASLTDELAYDDFDHAKSALSYLRSESVEFASMVEGKPIHYSLIEDYGTGCVTLCRLIDGELQWAEGIARP